MERGIRGSVSRLALLLLLGLAAPSAAQPQRPAAEGAQALADDGLRVVHWPGHRPQAERTLTAARAPLPLPGLPPGQVLPEGTIYLAPSPEVFDSLTGGRAPEWAAGVAFPRARVIVLPLYATRRTPLRDPVITLRHELAHLALNAYLPSPIPRWFDEGYATWVSGGWDEAGAWRLRMAFFLGRAPPLDSLILGWPVEAADAELAYLLSASAVSYLAERGGERGFAALLAAWREEGTLDAAIRRVYGMTLGQFETEWGRMVRRRYGWLLILSQVTLFWLFLAVLLIALFGIRRRRKRERLRELEAHDRMYPPSPDWELGEDAPLPEEAESTPNQLSDESESASGRAPRLDESDWEK